MSKIKSQRDRVRKSGDDWVAYRSQTIKIAMPVDLEPLALEAIHHMATAALSTMFISSPAEVGPLEESLVATTRPARNFIASILEQVRDEPINPGLIEIGDWSISYMAGRIKVEFAFIRNEDDGKRHRRDYTFDLRGEHLIWYMRVGRDIADAAIKKAQDGTA